jgi:hypothetical protein
VAFYTTNWAYADSFLAEIKTCTTPLPDTCQAKRVRAVWQQAKLTVVRSWAFVANAFAQTRGYRTQEKQKQKKWLGSAAR